MTTSLRWYFERLYSNSMCKQSSIPTSILIVSLISGCSVCCGMLQCVTVYYSVLQCVAVRCSALQCVAVRCSPLQSIAVRCSLLHFVRRFFRVRLVRLLKCQLTTQFTTYIFSKVSSLLNLLCKYNLPCILTDEADFWKSWEILISQHTTRFAMYNDHDADFSELLYVLESRSVAVCCSKYLLHCIPVCVCTSYTVYLYSVYSRCSALPCVAVCCSMLQCVAVCCSVLQ